jgi:hypothetical protein
MDGAAPPWLRVVGALAVAWNAVGVFSYLHHVGLVTGPQPVASGMPPGVTAAYAVGVFGAVAGSVALLLTSRWARPLLVISLAGLIVDWSWILTSSNGGSVPLGLTVLAVAASLVALTVLASRRRWLS